MTSGWNWNLERGAVLKTNFGGGRGAWQGLSQARARAAAFNKQH